MIDLTQYIPVLPTLAIICSAAGAALMARKAIESQCKTARTKATLDLIVNTSLSAYHDDIYEEFKRIRDKDGLISLLDSHSSIKTSKAKVADFLNHYEVICVGFEKGILDESFYYSYWYSTFIDHWRSSKELIKKIQEDQPTAYTMFEKYANSWEKGVLITNHK